MEQSVKAATVILVVLAAPCIAPAVTYGFIVLGLAAAMSRK